MAAILKFFNSAYKSYLLITFENSLELDPDQARQNVWPDLDPYKLLFDTLLVFLKEFFEQVDFEKKFQQTMKKHPKYSVGKELHISKTIY